jgi:hypothetical protein
VVARVSSIEAGLAGSVARAAKSNFGRPKKFTRILTGRHVPAGRAERARYRTKRVGLERRTMEYGILLFTQKQYYYGCRL